MSGIIELGAKAAVPAAVALALALARKYLKPSARVSPQQLLALDPQFQDIKWVVGVAMVAVGFVFFSVTYYVLVSLNRYLAFRDGPNAVLRIWPENAIWWFFPMLGAISLCWEITLQLWSAFGQRETAKLYRLWSDGRAGFDCTRILRGLALFIAGPIGVFTVLALPMHMTLRQQDILDCGYAWKGCESFEYANAMRMTEIEGCRDRDGKLHRRAGIVLDFVDGRRWSSAEIGEFRNSVDPKLSAFLRERTRLSLEHAEEEADIPKLETKAGGN